MEKKNKSFKFLIAFIILIGFLLRLYRIFIQGIYIDEVANLPLSVLVFSKPLDYNFMVNNALKPQFYLILYGFSIFIVNGFHNPQITYYTYLSYLPIKFLITERLLSLFINYIILIIIVIYLYDINKYFTLSFVILYSFYINLEFYSIIISTAGFVIPFCLLFIFFIYKSDLRINRYGIISAIVFGIVMGIQYYSIILILIPLLYYIIIKIKRIDIIKFYFIFIPISLLTFLFLNPIFILYPFKMLYHIYIDTTTVLSTSSGVVGIPIFLMNRITFKTPIYFPIIMIIMETQIPILILLITSIYYYIYKHFKNIKNKNNEPLDNLILLSILSFFLFIIFDMLLNYMRRNYVLLIIPILLITTGILSKLIILTLKTFNNYSKKIENNKIKNIKKNYFVTITLIILIVFLLYSSTFNQNDIPTYTNKLAYLENVGGANFSGAFNSAQADKYIGMYIQNHNLENKTILSLALTDMIVYYAPSNSYIQIWNSVNKTFISHYSGDYIVVDQWYSQLYGNPIYKYPNLFKIIYIYKVNNGYSILAKINSYYQQMILINNYSKYGINPNGSNFKITYADGLPINSWIQSISSTTITVYSKLTNDINKNIKLDIYPKNINVLSANGPIGEAPQLSSVYGEYDDGAKVFTFYQNFISNYNGFSSSSGNSTYLKIHNGITIYDGGIGINFLRNFSMPQNSTVLWNGEFDTGTSSYSTSPGVG
ncbi:hypothetical protein OXIME_000765 [Oxyplasma meridianum]|uniref:Glycosyltransferase RgtA/B/C/D-like domain-containing protein n=1 Tax=Oxyplasma meridianum TaxID=3073602 RepID=A0AAX4NHK9_9ARCH